MMASSTPGTRRGFLSRLVALVGGTTIGAGALADLEAQPTPRPASSGGASGTNEGPLVHPEDRWLDALPRGHRMVFDAYTAPGAVNAGRYCSNWFRSNLSGYSLKPDQLGGVIVLRAAATIFAFNDAMWAKYPLLGQQTKPDPATGKPFTFNPFLRPAGGEAVAQGVQWKELTDLGVHFAVCNGTTMGLAAAMAGASSGAQTADAVRQELAANLVPNSHLMATGIVAVGRAQEKGFTFGCGG
jgi:hypothetical protein